MIRKMHEDIDSTEERVAATTTQKEVKVSGVDSLASAQVPEIVGETVEVNADAASAGMNTDKTSTKTNASSSSSEEIDEEALEGEEKIGKDGE